MTKKVHLMGKLGTSLCGVDEKMNIDPNTKLLYTENRNEVTCLNCLADIAFFKHLDKLAKKE